MYYQNDKKWSNLRWYDSTLDKDMLELTEAAHSRRGADIGTDGEESTLGQSGCWHVSAASMLALFGQPNSKTPFTPKSFLRALRKSGLGTLTGYVSHPFVDPISILTCGEVQLHSFRDFGAKGATHKSTDLQRLLDLVYEANFCAIVNVQYHEFFGKGDSHYVLVHNKVEGSYLMHDPSIRSKTSLFDSYPKVFQITLYQYLKRI